jgi:hypothetical protein
MLSKVKARRNQVESTIRELTEALSHVHVSAGFANLIDGNEANLVNWWIHLEDYPKFFAASYDLLLVAEVDEFSNASFADTSMSISQCDSQHLDSQDRIDIMSDPETELRLNMLKYATEAVTMPLMTLFFLNLPKSCVPIYEMFDFI